MLRLIQSQIIVRNVDMMEKSRLKVLKVIIIGNVQIVEIGIIEH